MFHGAIPDVQPKKAKQINEVGVLFEETIIALKWHPSPKVNKKGNRMEELLQNWKAQQDGESYAILRYWDFKYADIREQYEEYLMNQPIEWTKADGVAVLAAAGIVTGVIGGLIAYDTWDAKQREKARKAAERLTF